MENLGGFELFTVNPVTHYDSSVKLYLPGFSRNNIIPTPPPARNSSMTNSSSTNARSLFVIDKDYGALGLAMYLLFRQSLAKRSTILLPQHTYELHKDQLSVSNKPYQSLKEILNVVDAERPDIVFLVSGYSYAYQNLLTIHDLRKLSQILRQRGCKLVTSDPYLGTFRQISDAPARIGKGQQTLKRRLSVFPGLYAIIAKAIRHVQKRRLNIFVHGVTECLKDISHFCPVPIDLLPSGDVNYVTFYNPLTILSEDELRAISAGVSAFQDVSAHRPRWLFVLARFDLEFQEKKYGKQCFIELVASKLRQCLDSGKHPTFIGPAAFVDSLSDHFSDDSGVTLLATCPFEEFQQRLMDAEIVFYWQIFSTSTFLRLMNGLPVFFFDRGHTARFFPPMHAAGLKSYYLAGSPNFLDIEQPLDAGVLAEFAAQFRTLAVESRQRLAKMPAPSEMVDSILAAD